ncbi:MAG: lysophospholipid acyltransferase family protein [bacterium]|nr:lysophospholipid acyltransferase family protein [bacterium]
MRRKKTEVFTDVIGYLIFYGIFNSLKVLPSFLYPVIARIASMFFYTTIPALKKKIRKNMDIVYGNQISAEQKNSLIKKILEKQMFFFIEWALWTKISSKEALKLIEFQNLDVLKEVSVSKKPTIIVSAHTGNFALMIAAMTYAGLPLTWIARDANNEYLARFMNRTRRKKGIYGISKKNLEQAIAISSQWLKKGYTLCLLIDQHSGKGTDVIFFGRKVQAPIGAAVFARKYDAQVFGAFIQHKNGFKHKVIIEGPYPIIKTDFPQNDFQKNTQFFYSRIEHYVRQKPEEWFTWLHRRFR